MLSKQHIFYIVTVRILAGKESVKIGRIDLENLEKSEKIILKK